MRELEAETLTAHHARILLRPAGPSEEGGLGREQKGCFPSLCVPLLFASLRVSCFLVWDAPYVRVGQLETSMKACLPVEPTEITDGVRDGDSRMEGGSPFCIDRFDVRTITTLT